MKLFDGDIYDYVECPECPECTCLANHGPYLFQETEEFLYPTNPSNPCLEVPYLTPVTYSLPTYSPPRGAVPFDISLNLPKGS